MRLSMGLAQRLERFEEAFLGDADHVWAAWRLGDEVCWCRSWLRWSATSCSSSDDEVPLSVPSCSFCHVGCHDGGD